ncbi:MAG: hypothetical protein JNL70_27890 [Saprospiraceae bacterium]|nr:hypothetical protein [Saprospiraceae bacterium]
MELNQIKSFSLEKMTEMFEAHDKYSALKNELLAETTKATTSKANVGGDNIESALLWLAFVKENPGWITQKLSVAEFESKADAARLLQLIEKAESEDQATSKAIHDRIASDLRFFWTNAEGFYDDASIHNTLIKEKYKDLPSISPKRKSDTQIEKDFRKLEAKRNKKNGDNIPPTT